MNQNKPYSGGRLATFFKSKSLLSILVIANLTLWLVTLFFPLVDYLYAQPKGTAEAVWTDFLGLSSEWSALLTRPWTLLTYMFLHADFWHILFNMLMLYWGGVLCCQYLNSRRFGWVYFLSGIGGALLYLLVYNLFPVGQMQVSTLMGASAAVLGVFVAVATYVPNQEVHLWLVRTFSVKIKWIALAFVLIDLLSISVSNAGGHIAHIGGALIGFLFVYVMRLQLQRPVRPKRQKIKVKRPSKNYHSTKGQDRPLSDDEFNRRRANDQKRIDAILDKISQSGYDHLTKEEKDFLFRKS